jgi:hypothetical protein
MLSAAHGWVVHHDEKRLFVVLYIGLALVLSIWISLFWLAAVVAVHFIFELVRQASLERRGPVMLAEVFWELKLDIALVLFALVLSLYMEIALGAVSAGLAGRLAILARGGRLARLVQAGAKAGSRFAGWQRALRGVLLSLDDAAQVLRALARGRGGAAAAAGAGPEPAATEVVEIESFSAGRWGSWGGSWSRGDVLATGLMLVCLGLIIAAPYITEHTWASTLTTMAKELRPFPWM